ncbi:MAG: hypothetical protein LBJ63_12115 [Prevotellaceae bacterium]|jgi:hypothetical protein|nr:hypothetical protein [Prevotellaceae bacterium]
MRKLKEFIFKTSYYRAFGFMLSGLSGAIGCFNEITNTVNNFSYIEGKIDYVFSIYPLKVKLENSRKLYKIYGKKLSQTLKSMKIKGKDAIIWYNKKNRIVQLIIDENMIFKYSHPLWLWGLMIFGLFLFVGHLIYIINFKKYKKIFYEKVIKNDNEKQNKSNKH